MGARNWTKEQRKAIDTRDKTLIVSAAAGSGKTATLTERIIEQITDPNHPVDLSELLIVTFTNAAAEEVRERVAAALYAAARQHPEDRRLERQLLTVRSAHIQTIDAFCNSLLRRCPEAAGLSPDFRVADAAEAALLSSAVMENLIAEVYDGNLPEVASAEEFEELSDCLTTAKSVKDLAAEFDILYQKCSGLIEGVRAVRPLVDLYDPEKFVSSSETPFGKYACRETAEFAKNAAMRYERSIRELTGGNPSEEKLAAFLSEEKRRIARFYEVSGFAEQRDLSANIFDRLVTVKKNEVTDATLRAKAMRSETKESLGKILSSYYLWTEDEWREHFATVFRTGGVLSRFLEAFDAAYTAEKRRRNLADFSDLEHLAYRCLYEEDRTLSPLALSLQKEFAAVYIDEYQDVNELQDSLFAAVSRPDNRFMVGDIKQCIYCFRGAEPGIFAGMKKRFSPIAEAEANGECRASIFMSQNFRCDRTVLDFVNGVFDTLFPLAAPSLGHDAVLDTLRVGKSPETQGNFIPEIHLVPKKEKPSDESGEEAEEQPPKDDNADESEEEEASNRERQAAAVASKASELLKNGVKNDGTPILPSDIAILLRNTTGIADVYRKALEKAGIPTEVSGSENFFTHPDVLLALSLLSAIDNPRRDIYLAAVMCSPLFSFSGDELLRLRRAGGNTLYEALCLAAGTAADREETEGKTEKQEIQENHPGEISDALKEKTAAFVRTLSHYRAISQGMHTDLLLSRLYRETGLLPLASNAGGKENLLTLQNFAKTYEKNGFCGLSGFLAYVRELLGTGASFGQQTGSAPTDAVHILTDHKSKGLEFPVCILAECQAVISNKDKKERIAFDHSFGISLRDRAPGGLALVENAVQGIVNAHIFEGIYEEEMRVLYVAMTRARERLYLFGNIREDGETFLEKMREKKETLTPYTAKHLSSYLEMAMMSGGAFRTVVDDPDLPCQSEPSALKKTAEESHTDGDFDLSDSAELRDLLSERFTFSYPSPAETKLPRKLSVSVLSPVVLDSTENETISLTIEDYSRENTVQSDDNDKNCLQKQILPVFYSGKSEDESAKRGIATHTFLQFCDFSALQKNGTDAEFARLLREGFLSEEDGKLVRLDEIRKFEKSALLKAVCRAKNLYRELRFHAKLPAELFTAEEETKKALSGKTLLVQGVIDCIYEDADGNLHLIDYKTDRLSDAALKSRALAQKILSEKHSLQLSYYAAAIREMFGRPPVSAEVYSLPLGDTVPVDA